MSVILNTRDVQLQATVPRLVPVTLPDNIIVPAVKALVMTAPSNVFQVTVSGVASPTSIALTATNRQVTGTITWSIVAGAGALTGSGGASPSTRTLTYANMTSDSITIRASVTEDSVTYTADWTIAKARDGTAGSAGARGSVIGISTMYDWRIGTWSDAKANRIIDNMLNGTSLKTDLATTGHLRLGDTVTLTNGSPWLETEGAYDPLVSYLKGAIVIHGGAAYRAIADTLGNLPTNTTYWALLVAAVNARGAWALATVYAAADSVTGLNAGGISTTFIALYAHTAINTFALEREGGGFAETRFWSGASWLQPAEIINGHLLVRGTVAAEALRVVYLSAIAADLGTVTAGNISGTANITISGQAQFEGITVAGASSAAVVANTSFTAPIGVLGFGSGDAGVKGISNTAGVQGVASGAGGAYGVQGSVVTVGASGAGVSGSSSVATGVGVRAANAAGGVALLIDSGTFKWSGYTWAVPDGTAAKVLRNNGTWLDVASCLKKTGTAATAGAQLGYLTLDTVDGAMGPVKVPYYAV